MERGDFVTGGAGVEIEVNVGVGVPAARVGVGEDVEAEEDAKVVGKPGEGWTGLADGG